MKRLIAFSFVLFFIFSCNNAPKPTVEAGESVKPEAIAVSSSTYTIDTTVSNLQWEGFEGLSLGNAEHMGTLQISKGELRADNGAVAGGEFTFNMKSIVVTDIPTANPRNAKLKKHLLSADFFDTEKFPEAKFVITSVQSKGADSISVSGNLTLKGIEKNITFPVGVQVTDSVTTAVSPRFYINRKDWEMHYRSENSLGDELIRNEVGIKINIVARKK